MVQMTGHPPESFIKKKNKGKKEIEAEKDEVAEKNMKRVVEPPADVRLISPFNLF